MTSGARDGTMRLFRKGRRIVPVLVLLGGMLAGARFTTSGDEFQSPPNFLAEAKANFKDWDLNGDGTLSFQETTRLVPRASVRDTSAAALAAVHLTQRRPPWYGEAFSRDILFAATPREPSGRRPPFEFYYLTGLEHIRETERTLFAGVGPNLRTIRQGLLGDCYFLATLGALVHRNSKDVSRLVRREADGSFYVKFPDGQPVRVRLVSDTEIALASFADGQGLWLNVLEKAYGELLERSARRAIIEDAIDVVGDGGDPIAAMTLFTGCDAGLIRFRPEGPRAVPSEFRVNGFLPLMRDLLITNTRGGRLTCCATANVAVPPGMAKRHLYAVLDFDRARDVVHLWNPWGNFFEPKGAPGLSTGYPVQHGEFQVSLADLIRIFDRVIYETDRPASIW